MLANAIPDALDQWEMLQPDLFPFYPFVQRYPPLGNPAETCRNCIRKVLAQNVLPLDLADILKTLLSYEDNTEFLNSLKDSNVDFRILTFVAENPNQPHASKQLFNLIDSFITCDKTNTTLFLEQYSDSSVPDMMMLAKILPRLHFYEQLEKLLLHPDTSVRQTAWLTLIYPSGRSRPIPEKAFEQFFKLLAGDGDYEHESFSSISLFIEEISKSRDCTDDVIIQLLTSCFKRNNIIRNASEHCVFDLCELLYSIIVQFRLPPPQALVDYLVEELISGTVSEIST
jgi:hypothetical protein